jgi:hypothetical protein
MMIWYGLAMISGFIGMTIMHPDDLPCLWISVFPNIVLIPGMLFIFLLRAHILLFKFGIDAIPHYHRLPPLVISPILSLILSFICNIL